MDCGLHATRLHWYSHNPEHVPHICQSSQQVTNLRINLWEYFGNFRNKPAFVSVSCGAVLGNIQSSRPLDVWSQKIFQKASHLVLHCRAQQSSMPDSMSRGNSLTTNDMGDMLHPSSPSSLRMNLHVGVLHYDPSFEPFPLLTDPVHYEPNTVDISDDKDMLDYWLNILTDSVQTIMAKAIASEGGKAGMLL